MVDRQSGAFGARSVRLTKLSFFVMPVEGGRVIWTDDRLDDLARHTEQGFARIDDDLRSLNARLETLGEGLNARFDALQRTMLAMMASILVGFAALIATQL